MTTVATATIPPAAPAAGPVLRRRLLGAAEPHAWVEVDGVRLAVRDEGSGPAVVCLHAIGHGAGDFAAFQRRFRDRFRVVAVDWPGHGASAPDREAPSGRRYAALLSGVVDALRLERVVVVGNSIGGAAAIAWAHASPQRARGLVLENPGGLDAAGDALGRAVLAAMARFFAAGARGARWWPAAYALYTRTVLQRRAAAAQRARIVAAGPEMAAVLRDAWLGFADPSADLRALAPDVACPVLFAWARRDRVVQLRRCRPAIARFPRARVVTFPAGHAPHLETPEAFAAAVEDFLGALPA